MKVFSQFLIYTWNFKNKIFTNTNLNFNIFVIFIKDVKFFYDHALTLDEATIIYNTALCLDIFYNFDFILQNIKYEKKY